MKTHLTIKSSNVKTGPIPVSTSSNETCPDACPLKKNGCYADNGPLGLHWKAVTEGKRGHDWNAFLAQIEKLPKGQLWRHNQSGDLPGMGNRIDWRKLNELVSANKGKRGFTYTHKPTSKRNIAIISQANRNGFVVNLSANNIAHADKLAETGLPVVTVLPSDVSRNLKTPGGRTVVVCPATKNNRIQCASCGLCQLADRKFIIGFPAHGTSAKKASKIATII